MLGTNYFIKYLSDISDAVSGAKKLETINTQMANTIKGNYSKATKIIGQGINTISSTPITLKGGVEAIKTVEKLSTVVGTADGRYKEFTTTQTGITGQVTKTSGALKDVTNQFRVTGVESAKAGKMFTALGQNIGQLASRAIFTIPIWMALRNTFMGSIAAVKQSLAAIIEYDRALQKLKKSLQGTPEEINKNFERAKDAITQFSIETGKSTEDITRAIQRFATVGFDFETAMTAGFEATRLSILLFGNAEETANAFARSLRTLVKDVNNATVSQDEIAEAMALTSELYEVNAFELSELNKGMEKFGGTAKVMGFTIAQTLTLFAALSTRGLNLNRGGALLRTTTLKLTANLGKLANELNLKVNPAIDTTFDVFTRVINAIAELKAEAGTVSPALSSAIMELFGVRSGEPILALVSDMKNVNIALKAMLTAKPDIAKFHRDVDELSESLGRQVEIYHNLNKEIGKGLLTGLTGGNEFEDAIKNINTVNEVVQTRSTKWGTLLTAGFQLASLRIPSFIKTIKDSIKKEENNFESRFEALGEAASEGLKNGLSKAKTEEVIKELAKLRTDLNLSDSFRPSEQSKKGLDEIENSFIKILSSQNQSLMIDEEAAKNADALNEALKERLKYDEFSSHFKEEALLKGMEVLDIETAILDIMREKAGFDTDAVIQQRQYVEHLKATSQIELELARAKGLIDNQLESLRIQGATNLQLLQTKQLLFETYNVDQSRMEILQNELDLQKALTAEKLNQKQLSNDAIKLFQIAQKYGVQTAFQASEFLANKVPVQSLQGGGKNSALRPILEEFFKAELEQLKAVSFYAGAGRNLPTPETRAIEEFRALPIDSIKLPDITTTIGDIKIEIKQLLEKEQLSQFIVDELKRYLDDNLTEQIEDTVENY